MKEPTTGAEELINETIDQTDASHNIVGELERQKEGLEAQEAATLQRYIDGIRPQINGALVTDLDPGTGGLYNGGPKVQIAEDVLIVDASVETTIARVTEVRDHEDYHAEHDHLAPMAAAESASNGDVVTIGDTGFTDTELIEGITVARTGEEFVSGTYRQYKDDLLAAVSKAGINLTDIEQAIDQQDLGIIDEVQRRSGTKPAPVLAA